MATRYEIKECEVLFYIESAGLLAVDFEGYGIAFEGISGNYEKGQIVKVKYYGKIGSKNFKIEIMIENEEE